MARARPPILLCDAGYYGTLAAARAYGRAGIPVTVVDSARAVQPALWSRYVQRRLRSPSNRDVDAFSEWLLRFGEREPGHVIASTSDDVTFALSLHRDELAKTFRLYQPELRVVMNVLDKGKLIATAKNVGLDVPETFFPENDRDFEEVARYASGPVMIKPRTQILHASYNKGMLVPGDAASIRSAYRRFVTVNTYGTAIHDHAPECTRPMLQHFYPEASKGVYSLAGFRDRTGRHFAVLGANKVLQRPRRMGIGLCFEDAPVDPVLARGAARLCEKIGYYGLFEMEFIRVGDRSLLIDMNPRFYNQLALDIARGLPLPLLVYAGALGDENELARLIATVPTPVAERPGAFCNRFALDVFVRAQRLFGVMTSQEATQWRNWRLERGDELVDAVADRDDPRPYAVEIAKQFRTYLRNPLLFWRLHRA